MLVILQSECFPYFLIEKIADNVLLVLSKNLRFAGVAKETLKNEEILYFTLSFLSFYNPWLLRRNKIGFFQIYRGARFGAKEHFLSIRDLFLSKSPISWIAFCRCQVLVRGWMGEK